MSTDCVIEFDNNPNGVFYSGETLSGTVVLVTRKPKSIHSICINVKGYASTTWTEGTDTNEHSYRGKDQYLDSASCVLRSEDDNIMELPAGMHSYKFHIALPEQLPSSFEERVGRVRYKVKVIIDRPWRFNNVFTRPFKVIYQLDLNQNHLLRLPTVIQHNKTFTTIFCQSGVLTATLSTPFSGYAVGQRIPFELYIKNRSSVGCHSIGVNLVQKLSFYCDASSRSFHISKKFEELYLGSVAKFENKKIRDFLEVPVVLPSSNGFCRLIDITYMLRGIVRTNGCHRNLKMSTPIVIGTIPLMDSVK